MTEPPPADKKRSRRVYAYWGAALALLVLAALACWGFVAPVLRVRRLAGRVASSGKLPQGIADDGGEQECAAAVGLYLWLPARWAPHRRDAVWLLTRCGRHATPALRRALGDDDPGVRKAALHVAHHLGGLAAEAVPEALAMADHPDAGVRDDLVSFLGWALAACEGSGRRGGVTGIWATAGGGGGGSPAPDAPPVGAFSYPMPDTPAFRREAPAPRELAPGAVRVLVSALSDTSWVVRVNASASLRQAGPHAVSAVPALARALEDTQSGVRANAAAALCGLGPAAARAAPALVKAIKDVDGSVRANSGAALAMVAPRRPDLLELLGPLLRDYDPLVRASTARAVFEARGRDGPGLDVLIAMLSDGSSKARAHAAFHLGAIGPRAKQALSNLEMLLKSDADDKVRAAAAAALKKIRGERKD